MKTFIIVVLMMVFNSCVSKESSYKDIKIDSLQSELDSVNNVCHELQLELWAQEELIYSQDTLILRLKRGVKK